MRIGKYVFGRSQTQHRWFARYVDDGMTKFAVHSNSALYVIMRMWIHRNDYFDQQQEEQS